MGVATKDPTASDTLYMEALATPDAIAWSWHDILGRIYTRSRKLEQGGKPDTG
jgi:hypothetical protein